MEREGRDRSFEEKLRSYSRAAASALMVAPAAMSMMALMPGRVDAAVHYSGTQNLPVSSANKYQYLDLNSDGSLDAVFLFYPFTGTSTITYATSSNNIRRYDSSNILGGYFQGVLENVITVTTRTGTATVPVIRNLPPGYSIGSGGASWYSGMFLGVDARAAFSTHTAGSGFTPAYTITYDFGNFKGTTGYLGVRFQSASCTGTNWHYGWIRFSATADASQGTVIDWAYEDQCNTPILAGAGAPQVAVPTLNQWGVLALVALLAGSGAVAMRRREET